MIEIFYAEDVDGDDAVPFTSREDARQWCALQLEFTRDVDTAELRFHFGEPRDNDYLTEYNYDELEYLIVDELLGRPESWGDTKPEMLSYIYLVRIVKVYESTDEATEAGR